jgi:multicomponent Na+:H+ antiporter subunit D
VAFAFLAVGISIKVALFPLHLWLPDAYTYAPSVVTTFLASTATKVAVYMLVRFFFTVFGPAFSVDVMNIHWVLVPLAILSILSGSVTAIYQMNVKRLLAYSSVAQIGYMVLGVGMVSVAGLTGGLLHLFNHALIKAALFMAMGSVMYRVGSVRIEAMRGLGKKMPWTMAAFVLGGLSLIGVPATVGFISKWYLVLGAVQGGHWFVAGIILLGSLLAVVYVWRVVEAAYFHEFLGELQVREAPLSMLIPTWILVGANVYFGLNASLTAGVASRAAEILLGVSP